jgi:hypothetical protein
MPLVVSGLGRATTGIIKMRNAILTMNAAGKGGLLLQLIKYAPELALALGLIELQVNSSAEAFNNFELVQTKLRDGMYLFSKAPNDVRVQMQLLQDEMQVVSKEGAEYLRQKIIALSNDFLTGKITAEDLAHGLDVLHNSVIPATKATEDLTNATVGQIIATQNNEATITSLMEQTGKTREEVVKYATEQGLLETATDDTTEATAKQKEEIDKLRNSFNQLIDDIFGGITTYNDFQEANWAVEEAEKAVAEAEKELEKAQKATGSRFTANDAALQTYLSTNSEYLELSAKGSEIQAKLNKMQEEGDTTSSAYYAKQQQLADVQGKLNEVVTEATKKTGDYTSTGKQTEKQLAATAEATKNLEQKYNDLDDAMIANIETAFKLSTEIGATTEQQEEARKKAIELGLQYVATGDISIEKFIEMASEFGLSAADIIKFADDMGIKLDDSTRERIINVSSGNTFQTVMEIIAELDKIKNREITVTTYYKKSYETFQQGQYPGGRLGGIFNGSEFLRPMLSASRGINLPKFDNGGVLAMLHPPEIVLNAKEAMQLVWNMANKPMDTKGTSGINNTYNITSPKPLTESEIKRQLDLLNRELGYKMGLN